MNLSPAVAGGKECWEMVATCRSIRRDDGGGSVAAQHIDQRRLTTASCNQHHQHTPANATCRSATQIISRHLWNPEVRQTLPLDISPHVHDPTAVGTESVHTLQPNYFRTDSNTIQSKHSSPSTLGLILTISSTHTPAQLL